MLQFVYGLQEAFTKIRSFVFVSELGEVTPVFQERDVAAAVEKALDGGDVINVYTRFQFRVRIPSFLAELLVVGGQQDDRVDPG